MSNFNAPPDIKVVRAVEDPLVEPGGPVVNASLEQTGFLIAKNHLRMPEMDIPIVGDRHDVSPIS